MDFANLRSFRPPFVPQLKSITDTSYFPTEDIKIPPQFSAMMDAAGDDKNAAKELAFVGYTFKRWETLRTDL